MASLPWHFLPLLSLLSAVAGFNLATDLSRLLTGPKGTNFGYSVALWQHRQHPRLVVGAPRGTNSTFGNATIPLGNIHLCEPSSGHCEADTRLPNLAEGDKSRKTLKFDPVRKQGIGFGETLFAADFPGSKLVACAPRYTIYFRKSSVQHRGSCFVLNDPHTRAQRLYPFSGSSIKFEGKSHWNNNHFTGYGMAGFSITMDMNQTAFFMGGPYAFLGQGTVTRLANVGQRNEDQIYTKAVTGDVGLDFSNEGWAITLGRFDGQKEILAVSTPNPGEEKGMVTLYDAETFDLVQVPTIKNDIIGAKFGSSLASGDFDGDGASDLVVGAPLCPGSQDAPDAGRIYVFYAPAKNVSQKPPELLVKGPLPWGRFGHAVASLGDVDRDGFEDLAVGAPSSGDGGRVYIFVGQQKGLNPVASQVLRASEFGPGLRGFGFSVDGGVDMDDNGYPDVIIGAVESDVAVFIRSAPLLGIEGNVTFDPPQISASNKSCAITISSGQTESVVCFEIVARLRYSALKWKEPQPANVSLVLDSKLGRLAFMQNKQKQLTYQTILTTSFEEKRFRVYVEPGRQRISTNVDAEARVTLLRLPLGSQAPQGLVPVPPILDPNRQNVIRGEGTLICEDLLTCFSRPDLVLQGAKLQKMVLGRDVRIELELQVKQDVAYEAVIEVVPPSIFTLRDVTGQRQIPECEGAASSANNISCRFDTKLRNDSKVPLTFVFESSPMSVLEFLSSSGRNEVPLTFRAYSDSPDVEPSNNVLHLEVAVDLDHQIRGLGISVPDSLTAFANRSASLVSLTDPSLVSQTSPRELGPRVVHKFVLSNQGSSPVVNSKMVMQIPNGKSPLLYMVDIITEPRLICSHPPLNQLGLQMEDGNDTSLSRSLETSFHTGGRRLRRAAVKRNSPQESRNGYEDATSQHALSCDNVGCADIICDLPPLVDGVTVSVTVTAHLVVSTLTIIHRSSAILESLLSIEIPGILGNPAISTRLTTLQLPVTIFKDTKSSNFKSIPWWYLALAVVVGLIVVMLLMIILYTLGFFKRKRVPYEDLKQEQKEEPVDDIPDD